MNLRNQISTALKSAKLRPGRALRLICCFVICVFHILNISQTLKSESNFKVITVTHSHDDSKSHVEALAHSTPSDKDPSSRDKATEHTHSLMVLNSPAGFVFPNLSEIDFLLIETTSFTFVKFTEPPVDPSLSSIFRPPIS